MSNPLVPTVKPASGPDPTPESLREAWDLRVDQIQARLPSRGQSALVWLRKPSRRLLRIVIAILLMLGGVFSILPILGLWMLPLGVALLSIDVPAIKAPAERCARALETAWSRLRRR